MAFREITPAELGGDVFSMFRQGMLLTVQAGERINTMTVGWGTLGVMWGKDVLISAVRPERYTYGMMEESDTFSLLLLSPEDKAKMAFCGTKSGRDVDKIAACGFTVATAENTPYFEEAQLVIVCKKVAATALQERDFLGDDAIPNRYYGEKGGNYHTLYFGEILKVLVRG